MKPIGQMTDDELHTEWLACEQYLNDPEPDNQERLRQAIGRQLHIEHEQDVREHYQYFMEHGYEE